MNQTGDGKPIVDVTALAALSRIEVKEVDIPRLSDEIAGILQFVEKVQSFELKKEVHAGGLHNVMREDIDPYESGAFTDALLSAAPKREGDYIEVKQVLAHTKKNKS